jgi:uncharacterized protein (DUF58 family)
MSKTSDSTENTTDNNLHTSISGKTNLNKRVLALFVALFAAIAAYVILQAGAAPKNQPAVTLSLSPSTQRMQVGDSMTLSVRLNTNGQEVNAVQADFTYPSDKFEFVSTDSVGSVFSIEAQSTGGSGVVNIARGSTTPVNGSDLFVTNLNFRAIGSGRKIQIRFTDTSAVLRAADSFNILQKKLNGSYTVQ